MNPPLGNALGIGLGWIFGLLGRDEDRCSKNGAGMPVRQNDGLISNVKRTESEFDNKGYCIELLERSDGGICGKMDL